MRTALDTPDARDARQLRRAGQDRRGAAPGRRRRRHDRAGVENEARAGRSSGRAARRPAARGHPRQPGLPRQGSGMRMGGGPQQFGIDAEQVPELLARAAQARRRDPRLPRLRRVAEPRRRDHRRGAARDGRAGDASWPQSTPGTIRYLNLGGGFGIPYSTGRTARPRPRRRELATAARRAHPSQPARGAGGRSSSGATSSASAASTSRASSTGRSRAARRISSSTAACTTSSPRRELRPGDPAQLPGRDRGTGSRGADARRSASWAACARRSTCSPTTSRFPRAEIGDLIVVFQAGAYGLTASPTAFLGHPEPAEVLV